MSTQFELHSDSKKTAYLIDGSAYVYRAYHAIKGLTTSNGQPTNAVFGFTRMLIKLLKKKEPKYLAIFFDVKGNTFRHSQYNKYKANRPPMPDDLIQQIPWIKKIISSFGFPIFEMNGFEADDLIGTGAKIIQKKGMIAVIVTGDKDFMQLVNDNCIIWDPMKDITINFDSIETKFGIKPIQLLDVMGFVGDKADNIPGVPGIGIKTGIKLIKKFHSMEECYQQINVITNEKLKHKLIKFKEQAFLSRKLVKINTNSPIDIKVEKLIVPKPDKNLLISLFKKLEFKQLQNDFTEKKHENQKKYMIVSKKQMLDKLAYNLEKSSKFALDVMTDSNNSMLAKLIGISISMKINEAFYIPIGHGYKDISEQLSISSVTESLGPILANPKIGKIGQNIKHSAVLLMRHGIELSGIEFDTIIASYLIDPSKKNHNLNQINIDFLNCKNIDCEKLSSKLRNNIFFDLVSIKETVNYACENVNTILLAHDILVPILKKEGLMNLMKDVEIALIPVLTRMELAGICINQNILQKLSNQFNIDLKLIEKKIYKLAGEIFNINSSNQVGYIMFDKLKLPVQKKTKVKKNFSTDINVLKKLVPYHNMPALVISYRRLSKLKSTYIDAILDLINPETDRIHTSFNQTITSTGRLSSSNPNLQNIPIRTREGQEIRKAFVPQKGHYFLSADYSQMELRILAHYSEDKILLDSFMVNEDIHIRTASEIFQIPQKNITQKLRRQAKMVNFGIIYGMSSYKLANELRIDAKIAQIYINTYFKKYEGVKKFIDKVIKKTYLSKRVSTLLGRIRHIKDIRDNNINKRKYAERIALNTVIQGTSADLIKIAMIKIDDILIKKSLKTKMLLSVHDEIIFEVPYDELIKVSKLIHDSMESIIQLLVPLKVNIKYGKNWAEVHSIL